ncbi:MAG: sugar ABC transporter substrate-binding protein [Rhodothermales bacterium]
MPASRSFGLAGLVLLALLTLAGCADTPSLTIATVNNADMIIMQRLSPAFEEATGIRINWVVLEENILRQRVTTDIATGGGQFDIVTIGSYETPLWARQGWLTPLNDLGESYAYEDLLPSVRQSLSLGDSLFAVPFYAESSFTYYRTDLFAQAGIAMPDAPTYEQIASYAQRLHDPANSQYGICLRGKPGWGENMAYFNTVLNTFGGRWFDMNWMPQLTSPEWHTALQFYVDLLTRYGPPGAASNGHNENRALFASGNCAMWIDATAAAGHLYNPSDSKVYDKIGFTRAPVAVTENGSSWVWVWALAIPATSRHADAARQFVAWATSAAYIRMVGEKEGWTVAPPGTRRSTYANPDYRAAAPFASFTEAAILSVDPAHPTRDPVPYTGIQYVAIPEFQGLGTEIGQIVAGALAGRQSVDEALERAQAVAVRTMQDAGYLR